MAKQMKPLTWISEQIKVANIHPTPQNYKIKTALGKDRLKESLKQFGLAGNCVVNYHPTKKGHYVLIDGNSRLEEMIKKKVVMIWASLPNRPLEQKEFKAMSAMFDFAKAGEVDVERIKQDLGTTSDFFKQWHMDLPMGAIKTMGKKGKLVEQKTVGEKKTVGAEDIGEAGTIMVNLFFSKAQHDKFRKQEAKLAAKYKTDDTTATVFKKFMS